MRIPIYVHTEFLTEPSMYPHAGYFDVLCIGEYASVRCSGQITSECSFQDAYHMARYVETRIIKIIKIALSYPDAEDFFHHFWIGFINANFQAGFEAEQNIDNDIVMLVAWQPIEENNEKSVPICISGIGISQIFAVTSDDKMSWAPIVQRPHPFYRPLGKPDKTVGYLSIQTPLVALGYTSLFSVSVPYAEIPSFLSQLGWDFSEQQTLLEQRIERWK